MDREPIVEVHRDWSCSERNMDSENYRLAVGFVIMEEISFILFTIGWMIVWVYFTAQNFFNQNTLSFALWLILGGILTAILIWLITILIKD